MRDDADLGWAGRRPADGRGSTGEWAGHRLVGGRGVGWWVGGPSVGAAFDLTHLLFTKRPAPKPFGLLTRSYCVLCVQVNLLKYTRHTSHH